MAQMQTMKRVTTPNTDEDVRTAKLPDLVRGKGAGARAT